MASLQAGALWLVCVTASGHKGWLVSECREGLGLVLGCCADPGLRHQQGGCGSGACWVSDFSPPLAHVFLRQRSRIGALPQPHPCGHGRFVSCQLGLLKQQTLKP